VKINAVRQIEHLDFLNYLGMNWMNWRNLTIQRMNDKRQVQERQQERQPDRSGMVQGVIAEEMKRQEPEEEAGPPGVLVLMQDYIFLEKVPEAY